jgi:ubiquinone/menaquinone biosynthesis C-methylase UbiE
VKPRAEWWESYFDERYLSEYSPLFSLESDRREVARLVDLLALPLGAKVLDIPCGQGRHSHLLAEAGFDVTGLDYSNYLLKRARERGTGSRLRYVKGDMRRLPARWTGRFDAVVNLFTSFGFFQDPADDLRTISEFARVLRPGGILIWHGASRDGIMSGFLDRDWWRASNGTMVAHERSFDPLSGVLTIRVDWSDQTSSGERDHRIRLYTATYLTELLADVGLVTTEAYDAWSEEPLTRASSEMLLVAQKEELSRRRRRR